MTALALKEKLATTPDFITELEACSLRAAEAVRPYLQTTTLEGYKKFLHMMYHYTLDSENKLRVAASKSDTEELKEYFLHMADEERGHYLLAQRDYEEFGLQINTEIMPAEVKAFNDFWYSLGSRNCNEYAGALFVFEGVADHVAKDIADLVQRLQLTKRQSRWFLVHVEADHEHGSAALEICKKYGANDPEAILQAAQNAEKKWIEVFTHAFTWDEQG